MQHKFIEKYLTPWSEKFGVKDEMIYLKDLFDSIEFKGTFKNTIQYTFGDVSVTNSEPFDQRMAGSTIENSLAAFFKANNISFDREPNGTNTFPDYSLTINGKQIKLECKACRITGSNKYGNTVNGAVNRADVKEVINEISSNTIGDKTSTFVIIVYYTLTDNDTVITIKNYDLTIFPAIIYLNKDNKFKTKGRGSDRAIKIGLMDLKNISLEQKMKNITSAEFEAAKKKNKKD